MHRASSRRAVLVVAALGLVHGAVPIAAQAQSSKRKGGSEPARSKADSAALPHQVLEMREAILSAVRSGNIDDLRFAIELNEMKPDFGGAKGVDPIAHLKSLSVDKRGFDLLAILGLMLETPPAVVRAGRDIENNAIYVWPDISEVPLDALTPAQQVQLSRLAGPAEAEAMRQAKRWTWWRLAIGADGTWHTFSR